MDVAAFTDDRSMQVSIQVIVLPDPSWSDRESVIEEIERMRYQALDVLAPLDSKLVCAAIIGSDVAPPLVVVAHGDACHLLPAVALSLRTQHRDTAGYVLIDPDAPPSTDIWPEAPVTVVSGTEQVGTSLRGWPIVPAPQGIPEAVAKVITQILSS